MLKFGFLWLLFVCFWWGEINVLCLFFECLVIDEEVEICNGFFFKVIFLVGLVLLFLFLLCDIFFCFILKFFFVKIGFLILCFIWDVLMFFFDLVNFDRVVLEEFDIVKLILGFFEMFWDNVFWCLLLCWFLGLLLVILCIDGLCCCLMWNLFLLICLFFFWFFNWNLDVWEEEVCLGMFFVFLWFLFWFFEFFYICFLEICGLIWFLNWKLFLLEL